MLAHIQKAFRFHKIDFIGFVIFTIPAIIYVVSIGPIVCHDTIAYYKMRVNLLPIYPIFYRGMVTVFGKEIGNYIIQGIYLLFTLPIIHWFVYQLRACFKISRFAQVLILITLYIPIYVEKELLIMNNLGTEGFSLAIYLLIIVHFYKGFVNRNYKNIVWTLLWVMIMCLLRGQFKYLFPLLLLYEVIYQLKKRQFKLVYIMSIVLAPIVTNLIDATYHKILHDKFVTSPFTFITLNSIPMFVSDHEDVNLFEDEYTKDFFEFLYHRLSSKNMLYSKYSPESINEVYEVYYNNMPVICNQTIHEEGNLFLWQIKNEDGDWSWVYNERLNQAMMPILIKDNFDKWIKICVRNFIECFRGVVGMLIFLLFYGVVSFRFLFKSWNPWVVFIWFMLSVVLVNAFTVTIAIHAIERFFFYNYWLVIFSIFMFLKLLKNKWTYQL